MISKIKMRVGEFEIEFEGNEEFIAKELPILFDKFAEIYEAPKTEIPDDLFDESDNVNGDDYKQDIQNQEIKASANQIALKIGASKSTELVLAAMAGLCLVKNIEIMDRKQINEEMKNATNHYKTSHSKNLTQSLNSLMKAGRINEVSKGKYAISASTLELLRSQIV